MESRPQDPWDDDVDMEDLVQDQLDGLQLRTTRSMSKKILEAAKQVKPMMIKKKSSRIYKNKEEKKVPVAQKKAFVLPKVALKVVKKSSMSKQDDAHILHLMKWKPYKMQEAEMVLAQFKDKFKHFELKDEKFAELAQAFQDGKIKNKDALMSQMKMNMTPKQADSKPQIRTKYNPYTQKKNEGLNGSLADPAWPEPTVAVKSDALARQGLFTKATKSEFKDADEILKAKVQLMAKMIKKSQNCVFYVGAGMSTSAGLNDYASAGKKVERGNRLQLRPTVQYHVCNSLYEKGYIKQFVTQNHDGLAQKAGLPWSIVNEIHGSWFDPKNRVKMMDEKLDPNALKRFEEWRERADLVIVVGTSLAGMLADSIAVQAAMSPERECIIINLQENPMTKYSQLNIFADISKVFKLLAAELGITVLQNPKVYGPTNFRL